MEEGCIRRMQYVLHKYPRSKKAQYIPKSKEKRESYNDIHCPPFCLLGVLFALTAPCPKYSGSDESEYSEEHCEVYKPFGDSSDEFLEARKTRSFECTFVFSCLRFYTVIFRDTDTGTTWYFFCYDYLFWSI